MTVQEAINMIRYRIETASEIAGKGADGKAFEDLDMAIEALEKQSKLECVINRLEKEKSNLTTWAEDEAYKLAINKAIEIIKEEMM